jgi:hypothetical protein
MPPDLAAIAPLAAAAPTSAVGSESGGGDAAGAPGEAGAQAAGRSMPNPTVRLDGALGIVVIEFRDAAGAVTTSIPTQQQLEAYRQWARTHATEPGAPGSVGPLHFSGTDTA